MSDEAACGICDEEVTYDDKGVCCDRCEKWYHTECEQITDETYEKLQESDNSWYCRRCNTIPNTNMRMKRRLPHLKIASLNCRGMKGIGGESKRHHIAEDMTKYQLDVLAIQETHIGGDPPEEIETLDGKGRYMIYHSSAKDNKTKAGTAVVVRKGTNVTFKPLSDRICLMRIKVNANYTLTIINAYAPTLPVSEKNPDMRENFYDELQSVVRAVSNRETLIIAGDFNAKTGRTWREYPDNIGKFGKGEVNSNGKELLEFCNRRNLVLANTLFRHKMAHRSTWESPATHTDRNRRNPYRNMIDYIIIQKADRRILENARSHNGIMTYTDHRMVLARFNLERLHILKKKSVMKVNIAGLHDPVTRAKYQTNVEMKIMDEEDKWNEERVMNAQEQWNVIVNASHKAADEVIGRSKSHVARNPEIQKLSDKQREIGLKINESSDTPQRKEWKKERNSLMTKIHEPETIQIECTKPSKASRE